MSYFDLYDIPVSFNVNKAALKKKYYELSRKLHPDFYTQESEDKQAEILELSSKNNEAYKVLRDFDKRMKYILDMKGVIQEEGKNTVPQMFLMEMMDINEALMELEFDFDKSAYEKVKADLKAMNDNLLVEVQPILDNYNDESTTERELIEIKNYYFKRKYLLRIQDNLSKFASL